MRAFALLCAALLLAGCEKASRIAHEDAAPPPRPVDAAPPPRPPDAAPPPLDAAPPRPKDGFDACETDDDCTMYGNPCGGGMVPVNKRFVEQARAAAKKRCPREPGMLHLVTSESMKGRCVRERCHSRSELGLP